MKEGHARSQSSVPLLPYAEITPPSTPLAASFRKGRSPFSIPARRRSLVVALACLSVISLGVLASWTVRSYTSPSPYSQHDLEAPPFTEDTLPWDTQVPPPSDELKEDGPSEDLELATDLDMMPDSEYSPYLNGAPTQSFRDNLRNDTQYITSWISAGWSECPVPRSTLPDAPMLTSAHLRS